MTTTPRRLREPSSGSADPMDRWLAPNGALSILVALVVIMLLVAQVA